MRGMNDRLNFQKLKEAREAKGLTQEDVADELKVTPMLISYYERGMAMPPGDKLIHLCQFLGLELSDLRAVAA
jgi:transcriptional regulator with XRE-family HTH domain